MSGQTAVVFRNEKKEPRCLLGLSIWNCLRTQQISRCAVTDSAKNKKQANHSSRSKGDVPDARAQLKRCGGPKVVVFFLKNRENKPPSARSVRTRRSDAYQAAGVAWEQAL